MFGQELSSFRELLFHVAVAVAPAAELLDDPRGEPGRRVVEAVTERLRLGALNLLVRTLVLHVRVPFLHRFGSAAGLSLVGVGLQAEPPRCKIEVQADNVRGILNRDLPWMMPPQSTPWMPYRV